MKQLNHLSSVTFKGSRFSFLMLFCSFVLLPKLNFYASNTIESKHSVEVNPTAVSFPSIIGKSSATFQFLTAATQTKLEDKFSAFEIEENEDSFAGKKQVATGLLFLLLFALAVLSGLHYYSSAVSRSRTNSLFSGKPHYLGICSFRI